MSVLACSLLKTSRKSWYSLGMELRLTDALENVEQAFAVTSERASWKIFAPSVLQMHVNVAVLMKASFGALSFGITSQGSEISVAREVEACKGGDISDELSTCGVVSNKILPNTQSIDGLSWVSQLCPNTAE